MTRTTALDTGHRTPVTGHRADTELTYNCFFYLPFTRIAVERFGILIRLTNVTMTLSNGLGSSVPVCAMTIHK